MTVHKPEDPEAQGGPTCSYCGGGMSWESTVIEYGLPNIDPVLTLHPKCAEKVVIGMTLDLGEVIDKDGFVVGNYLNSCGRYYAFTGAVDKLLLSSRVLSPSTGEETP